MESLRSGMRKCRSHYVLVEVSVEDHRGIMTCAISDCGCNGELTRSPLLMSLLRGKTLEDLQNGFAEKLSKEFDDKTVREDALRQLTAVRMALEILNGRQAEPLGHRTYPVRIEREGALSTIRVILSSDALENRP